MWSNNFPSALLKYTSKFLFNLFIFREKGERKRGREMLMWVGASHAPPKGDLAHNPGMYPDWESNQRPVGCQASDQSTKPHKPGLLLALRSLTPDTFGAK